MTRVGLEEPGSGAEVAGLEQRDDHRQQRADKGTDARVEEVSARIDGDEEVYAERNPEQT